MVNVESVRVGLITKRGRLISGVFRSQFPARPAEIRVIGIRAFDGNIASKRVSVGRIKYVRRILRPPAVLVEQVRGTTLDSYAPKLVGKWRTVIDRGTAQEYMVRVVLVQAEGVPTDEALLPQVRR